MWLLVALAHAGNVCGTLDAAHARELQGLSFGDSTAAAAAIVRNGTGWKDLAAHTIERLGEDEAARRPTLLQALQLQLGVDDAGLVRWLATAAVQGMPCPAHLSDDRARAAGLLAMLKAREPARFGALVAAAEPTLLADPFARRFFSDPLRVAIRGEPAPLTPWSAPSAEWSALLPPPWPDQRWSTRGPTVDEQSFADLRVDDALVAGLKWHERDRLWSHRANETRPPRVIVGPEGTLLLISWELPAPCVPRGVTELWLDGALVATLDLPEAVPLVDLDGDGWPEFGVYPGGSARAIWHMEKGVIASCCGQ